MHGSTKDKEPFSLFTSEFYKKLVFKKLTKNKIK